MVDETGLTMVAEFTAVVLVLVEGEVFVFAEPLVPVEALVEAVLLVFVPEVDDVSVELPLLAEVFVFAKSPVPVEVLVFVEYAELVEPALLTVTLTKAESSGLSAVPSLYIIWILRL